MLKATAALVLCSAGSLHATETMVMSPVPWDAQQSYLERLRMPAEGTAEVCERLETGAKVQWRYKTSASVDFNVHARAGKTVTVLVRKDRTTRADAVFTAASAQEYCWSWTNNSGGSVELTLHLKRR
ncbi:hypothetical protein LRS03_08935 [Rhizobacter sp. J219]|uniref:hypothetical protein n=1 Tax=Rhizobacter sp. J219 TaxID=2898430 RepID=UPI00215124DC|nr:hypothetical protein [Rhizobacter sp. J219]MCR5882973.1 hypothetical protein [Rhizobacter sp. J219]